MINKKLNELLRDNREKNKERFLVNRSKLRTQLVIGIKEKEWKLNTYLYLVIIIICHFLSLNNANFHIHENYEILLNKR